jgi:ABC-type uncharacterized transport system permease subunit
MNESAEIGLLVSAIALGTPLLFATLGEILSERSGVLNLGVQGIMLVGAVSGFWAVFAFENLWLGIIAAMLAGAALSAAHAFNSVTLRVNQIVSGLALALFGIGLSTFIGRTGSEPLAGNASKATFESIIEGGIADWPLVGPLIFGHDPLVYLSWVMVAVASYYVFRTKPGLSLRSVGEDPASAESAGVSVSSVRYTHVLIGGALCGLGGAYFSLALNPSWQDEPIGQAGWIAIALVILASWRPWRALLAAYAFGLVGSPLNFYLQNQGAGIPPSVLSMLPFVMAIVAMIVLTAGKGARRLGAPAALGIPYYREQR